VHFACWVPSVKLTSVTSATSLVATQVVWAAVIAAVAGKRPPKLQFAGIAIALTGVLILTGIDFALSPTALFGDLLALLGAVLVAAYMFNGQKVRQYLPLSAFTSVVYLTAAITLLAICLVLQVPLFGYSIDAWLLIGAVTLFAQFGGHTFYNRALRSFSPTAIATTILFQIPGGSLLGWAIVGQVPELALIPAAITIAIGMVLVIRSERPKGIELEAGIDV
jgi:drug/metabolite transporter (DMT)-like permease